MSVGLALIAKNEEELLPRLLASCAGAFDQVALLDTGSEDKTVEVFEKWAEEERRSSEHAFRWDVGHFEWCDDFAAARTAADALLDTDWICWADCDDIIQGAPRLRELAAQAPEHIAGLIFSYDYAQDPNGNCLCLLKRERLVRRGKGTWEGRVHEAQGVHGQMMEIPPEQAVWIHKPPNDGNDSSERNLRILNQWVETEPENPRVLGYIGTEKLLQGKLEEAAPYFERYLALKTGWDEERAQIHRKLARCQMEAGDHEAAIAGAFEALRLMPSWPDSYLTLAEAHYFLEEYDKAIEWAGEVLKRGVPETLLIVNPLDYVFLPKVLLAGSHGALGRVDEAITIAEDALQLVPQHEGLRDGYQRWAATQRREAVANTWTGAARMLCRQDEQLKALRLLEDTVPYFATDHPAVVALRSEIRERVRPLLVPDDYDTHYEVGGSKPEDMIPDDKVAEIAGSLPRAHFLLEGIRDQMAEAA